MKNLITILLVSFYSISAFSTVDIFSTTKSDTIKRERFDIVLFDDFSWEYVNHDSVIKVLKEEDAMRIYNYIVQTKFYEFDSTKIFFENWDNTKINVYGSMSYERALDTIMIDLINEDKKFTMPTYGNVSSRFGWRNGRLHQGVDLKINTNDSIFAAFDGIVRYSGYIRGGYGNLVIIRHDNGLETFYAHLSSIKCKENEIIKAGELVGFGGSTGRSTGPHLHFEIRFKDNPINPEILIDFENKELISETLFLMPEKFGHVKEICEAQYHTVQSGESLWTISMRYKTSINTICALNNISINATLRIGQNLRVR
jgi:hypothetical protein